MYVQPAQSIAIRYPSITRAHSPVFGIFAFFAAHVPLALLMKQFAAVGVLHAFATLAVGLWFTTFKSRPERVAYIAAYITGAEVLWRMTQVPVFWEFGKYAVAALLIVSMVVRRNLKAPILPLVYFTLLLPSVALTTSSMDFQEARNDLSFNLSGPFALMISAWFFSQIELSREKILRLFLVFIGPVVGIVSIAAFSTLTAQELRFGGSNFVTSGGFGPNQVSAVLGLGALAAYLYAMDQRVAFNIRLLTLAILVVLATQSALTLSRGGLYVAGASAMAASLFLIQNTRSRMRFLVVAASLSFLAYYIVLPRLDALSKGGLKTRFESTKLTGRDLLAGAELRAWKENPLLGLGPGRAESYRNRDRHSFASHTEYTRLLAEHGVLGFEALFILLVMAVVNLRRPNTPDNRALIVASLVWSLLFMAGNAMRLVAASFMFGLTFVNFLPAQGLALNRWHRRIGVSR